MTRQSIGIIDTFIDWYQKVATQPSGSTPSDSGLSFTPTKVSVAHWIMESAVPVNEASLFDAGKTEASRSSPKEVHHKHTTIPA